MNKPPPLIRSYTDGGFTIGEDFHRGAIVILGVDGAGFAVENWAIEGVDRLSIDDFAPVLQPKVSPKVSGVAPPDLMLLGVGATLTHPYAELRVALTGVGLPLEVQSTPAICRTWNLLLSEGRRVALAAIPLP